MARRMRAWTLLTVLTSLAQTAEKHIGSCHRRLGDWEKAWVAFKVALNVYEKDEGKDSPSVAATHHEIGIGQ